MSRKDPLASPPTVIHSQAPVSRGPILPGHSLPLKKGSLPGCPAPACWASEVPYPNTFPARRPLLSMFVPLLHLRLSPGPRIHRRGSFSLSVLRSVWCFRGEQIQGYVLIPGCLLTQNVAFTHSFIHSYIHHVLSLMVDIDGGYRN